MDELLHKLKGYVIEKMSEPSFVHHNWYVKYHIEIVDKIANELCEIYTLADGKLVTAMVWMHDLGKTIEYENDAKILQNKGVKILSDLGFEKRFSGKVVKNINIMESWKVNDLSKSPIEVQIVSSADGASHMIGPFNIIFAQENPSKPLESMLQGSLNKAESDWDKKIILPEVKEMTKERYIFTRESLGDLPKKIF